MTFEEYHKSIEYIKYNINNKIFYNSNDLLYHYTSPQGLKSILENGGNPVLWFSRVDCLNDITEGKEIIKLYKFVCDKLLNSNEITQEFYNIVYDLKPRDKVISISKEVNNKYDILKNFSMEEGEDYICCFSKEKDSLSMWNYYVKGYKYEGYNLGFNFFNLKTVLPQVKKMQLLKVIYDNIEKENIIAQFLREIYKISNLKDASHKLVFTLEIIQFLTDLKYAFKNKAFEHEKEVRIKVSFSKSIASDNVKFRIKNGLLIPYLELEIYKKCLRKIIIGPMIEKEIAKDTLIYFLEKNNYYIKNNENNGIEIVTSEIPIRY